MIPLLAAAGIYDVRQRRIPNNLILSGWLCSCCIRFWREGITGVQHFIMAVVIIIAIGLPVYRIRAVGAGDVKLLSVIGGMHGLKYFFSVSVVWLILAGSVSAVILLRNQLLQERFRYAWFYFTAGRVRKEPYYSRERDGTKCTIILAPILAIAYILVLFGRWGGI